LSVVLLYAIHDIARCASVQDCVSSCRLVQCAKDSAGKRLGTSGKKNGECPPPVGLVRGGDVVLAPQSGRATLSDPLREKTGQGKSLNDPGSPASASGLLEARAHNSF